MRANLPNRIDVRKIDFRTHVMFYRCMASADRLRQITDAVREAGHIGVAELAGLTGASEMTTRRDLEILADQGVLERYRGGARSLLLRGDEPPFALRAREGLEAKRRIAAEVAGLIADGESVVLDSGTTCLEVARALEHRRLTVMPLSLHAANTLTRASQLTLLVPGGRPRPGELALTGPLTTASLAALRFDTAVIGCCGLNAANGLTAYDLDDAAVKRAAIASARRVIAVAEAAKLPRTALAFVTPASALHAVVTEETAPRDETDALAAAGVTVRKV
jgi:DeoR/GlpR family transcriptional regulator of sugar metabolism